MNRFVSAIFAASAFSAPALAADCGKDYKEFWSNIEREAFALINCRADR
jgi:hypothetical protein